MITVLENIDCKTKPIALIAVEIPQQAMGKARREELQRKAGSRLLKIELELYSHKKQKNRLSILKRF